MISFLNKFKIVKFGKNHKIEYELFPNSNIAISTIVSLRENLKPSKNL
jgi:hypothetical protein